MTEILGLIVVAAGIWAATHTGTESPAQAKRDWGVATVLIIGFGTLAVVQLL